MGVFVPDVTRTLLTDRNKEYMKDRIDLKTVVGGDEAWEGAKPVIEAIGLLLKEKGGPFVMGETGKSFIHHLHLINRCTQATASICLANVPIRLVQYPTPTSSSSLGCTG